MLRDELMTLARDLDSVERRMRQLESTVTGIRYRILRELGVPRPEDLTLKEQQAIVAEQRAPRFR